MDNIFQLGQNHCHSTRVVGGVKSDFSVSLCPFLRSFRHIDKKWTQGLPKMEIYPMNHSGVWNASEGQYWVFTSDASDALCCCFSAPIYARLMIKHFTNIVLDDIYMHWCVVNGKTEKNQITSWAWASGSLMRL